MIITEKRIIRGKEMNYTYSNSGKAIRCGKIRYKDAADPIDIQRAYFEENPDPIEESESNDNELQ